MFKFETAYFDDPIVNGRAMDVFMPAKITRYTALFFIHGGGWCAGSRTNYHAIMRAFNKKGFICASTDYRLRDAGVNILDQLTDIRHGYRIFSDYLRQIGRPVKIFTHGSSAGAHLTALLTFAKPGECGESLVFGKQKTGEWTPPVGTALQATPVRFEPWDDIFPQIWAEMQKIAGVPYAKNKAFYKKVAPMTYIRKSSPPVLFMEAECEHMFPAKFNEEFAAQMRRNHVRAELKTYTMAEHGFFYDVTRRQQKEAFDDILKFVESL